MGIIARMSYPPESVKEMAKRYMEIPPLPDFMNRTGPYVGASLSDGVHIEVLYELDNAKLAEGMDFVANFYTMFFGVPGFKYEIHPYFEVTEALKMIGMG